MTHNNDLMVFSPSGQFRFTGEIALTPINASLPQASSYPTELLARPVQAGNDVFFATSYGASAGISQYSLAPQIDNLSVASPMADMIIGLIEEDIQQIIASPNLGVVLVRPETDRDLLYVMEFEPQIDILKPLEPSWSHWVMDWGMQIVSMRSTGDAIEFMAVGAVGESDEGQPRLYRIDLFGNRKVKKYLEVNFGDIHLDCRVTQAGVNTALTISDDFPIHRGGVWTPSADILVVQGADCPDPGAAVTYTGTRPNLVLDEDMGGGTVFYGYRFISTVVLPDFDIQDASGIIQTAAQLRVGNLEVTVTGPLSAQVSVIRSTRTPYPVQDWPGPAWSTNAGYDRATWRVQVQQDSNNVLVALTTDDHLASDIHQVEWEGTYNKVGRRF